MQCIGGTKIGTGGTVMSDWTQEHYVLKLEAEIERLAEELRFANAQIMCDNAAISQWRSIWKYLKSENERLRDALERVVDAGMTTDHFAIRIAEEALKG